MTAEVVPFRPEVGHRTWGDGLGDGISAPREHKIAAISYPENPRLPCWSVCISDGERFEAATPRALERAWDVHRGQTYDWRKAVGEFAEQADDEEVERFLRGLTDDVSW
jgi:hypothetical protein